jgi:galactose-1-phosphate uridylyltransferase
VEGVHSLAELTEEDVANLAKGISAVLSGYENEGYGSFNFTLYFPPLKEKTPWFCPCLRIITRQNFYENYRTDDYFLQRQLGAELILTPPERLAEKLRSFFKEVA